MFGPVKPLPVTFTVTVPFKFKGPLTVTAGMVVLALAFKVKLFVRLPAVPSVRLLLASDAPDALTCTSNAAPSARV